MSCVTHHHTCDCREAKFQELEAMVSALREALGNVCMGLGPVRQTPGVGQALEALTSTAPAAQAHDQRVRDEALSQAGHALVGVARDYRAKYGKGVEHIVCLPLKDGIEAIRTLKGKP